MVGPVEELPPALSANAPLLFQFCIIQSFFHWDDEKYELATGAADDAFAVVRRVGTETSDLLMFRKSQKR
jgi:hypothetical protein